MKPRTIICDANILIDYLNAGEDCLQAACEYAELVVPNVVLSEVRQLDMDTAGRLGIEVLEVPLDLLGKAGNRISGCSMQDTICFLLAKQKSWICATNDGKLRKQCLNESVKTVRGFRLLADIVAAGCMSKQRAKQAGRQIAKKNREITEEILAEFDSLLP